jgi:hypothetical protein
VSRSSRCSHASSRGERRQAPPRCTIDGNAGTRWASKFEDGAWIQYDFVRKTQIGYMKLAWENSYGKEYALQISDDGATWSQLRYVSAGKGGTEEFYNLGTQRTLCRLQGVAVARSTATRCMKASSRRRAATTRMPTLATSPRRPASGSGLAPLPTTLDRWSRCSSRSPTARW